MSILTKAVTLLGFGRSVAQQELELSFCQRFSLVLPKPPVAALSCQFINTQLRFVVKGSISISGKFKAVHRRRFNCWRGLGKPRVQEKMKQIRANLRLQLTRRLLTNFLSTRTSTLYKTVQKFHHYNIYNSLECLIKLRLME